MTLRGNNPASGAPIWLNRNDPTVLNTSLTLSLNDGNHYTQDGKWEITTIFLAVPTAGCYTLQATWGNNQWVRYFAAGALVLCKQTGKQPANHHGRAHGRSAS